MSKVSTQLAYLDDREFRAALKAAGAVHDSPWGLTYDASVDGSKVFVKRIPLTEVEAARPWSTKNHFRLPNYYSYGVGSAGFGAWRELIAHIKTTNWVLEGGSPNFPLLLHHRVLPRTGKRQPDRTITEQYVQRWNNSRAIGDFAQARASAPSEIWLVIEHIPQVVATWLLGHQPLVNDVVDQLCETITFLRNNGIVHFDLHFGNVVTDAESVYVVDFGLVNDEAFHLTKTERAFLARHAHYDYALAIACVGLAPTWKLYQDEATREQVMRKYEWLRGARSQYEHVVAMFDHLDEMTSRPLKIEPVYADAMRRYREIVLYMSEFISTMGANRRKNTLYDDDHMRRLLDDADVPMR